MLRQGDTKRVGRIDGILFETEKRKQELEFGRSIREIVNARLANEGRQERARTKLEEAECIAEDNRLASLQGILFAHASRELGEW